MSPGSAKNGTQFGLHWQEFLSSVPETLMRLNGDQIRTVLLVMLSLVLGYQYFFRSRLIKAKSSTGSRHRQPPVVSGSLPFIGHAWSLYRDALGFIRAAHIECGPIFQYNLFGKPIVVLCDPALVDEYYRKDDVDGISFSETVNDAAAEFGLISPGVGPNMMSCIVAYTGSVLRSKSLNEILKIVGEEGEKTLQRLRGTLDFQRESARYLVAAFTRVMFDIEFQTTDALVAHIRRGQKLLTPLQTFTSILPAWLIRLLVKLAHPFVIPNDEYVEEIQGLISSSTFFSESTNILNNNDSGTSGEELTKIGQDYLKPSEGSEDVAASLSKPVAELLVFALVLLTDIFGLITGGALLDWTTRPLWKERLTEECMKFVSSDKSKIMNLKDVVNSKVLNAFLMESVRLNAAALISARKPLSPDTTLGDYDVGHAHVIRIAMREHMQNTQAYTNPEEFDPDRYLLRKESYGSRWNLGWGNGTHKCPAKFLTMTIIKVIIILFVVNFDAKVKEESKGGPSKIKICRGGASSFLNVDVDLEVHTK